MTVMMFIQPVESYDSGQLHVLNASMNTFASSDDLCKWSEWSQLKQWLSVSSCVSGIQQVHRQLSV